MKAVLALLLGVAAATDPWDRDFFVEDLKQTNTFVLFQQWAKGFDRQYESFEEEALRYTKFLANFEKIARHNSQGLSWTMGLNQFSDMDESEFMDYIGNCYIPEDTPIIGGEMDDYDKDYFMTDPRIKVDDMPLDIDWTTKGVVTPVKNQGSCGSCWAFSTTGAIECDYAIKNGKLNSLAEQQLVDCAKSKYNCHGCQGGMMDGAMKYTRDAGGVCLETAYRYTARDGSCKASTCGTKYDHNSGGYHAVTRNNEQALQSATTQQCVSVGVMANSAFQSYRGGVFSGNCGTSLNHGVLIVGYGTSGSQQYWKVKNSWGSSWGAHGYILIIKGAGKNGSRGECGINMEPITAAF